MHEKIARNLREVKTRIAEAALRVGCAPETVQLVAVSKTFPVEAIVAAYESGQRHFGENRSYPKPQNTSCRRAF